MAIIKVALPARVNIFRTTVRLNTFRAMRESAMILDKLETNQAPRYGRAERKPFWTDRIKN